MSVIITVCDALMVYMVEYPRPEQQSSLGMRIWQALRIGKKQKLLHYQHYIF